MQGGHRGRGWWAEGSYRFAQGCRRAPSTVGTDHSLRAGGLSRVGSERRKTPAGEGQRSTGSRLLWGQPGGAAGARVQQQEEVEGLCLPGAGAEEGPGSKGQDGT